MWAISNARALRAESGCIKALRPLLPRKSGEPLCSSVAKDDHHRRTKLLSAVFAVTVKRPAMSARKVLAHVKAVRLGRSSSAASGDTPDVKSAGGGSHESPARYLPRARSAPSCRKALPRQEAAVPQNRRSQHDGSIEARNLRTALGLR